MSWLTPNTAAAFQSGILPAEKAAMLALLGADNTADILTRSVEQVRDAIRSGGYALGDDGTIPSGLESDCYAIFIWRLLTAGPSNEKLQTKTRQQNYKDALTKLDLVAKQKFSVEPPNAGLNPSSGSWNSENKLIMRTHPVPQPAQQNQSLDPTTPPYANPAGPADD
jgi:hypothetical protein